MKIKLYSDLHCEGGFDPSKLDTEPCDVLVLAGDICSFRDLSPLEYFAKTYKHVLYVPGNHEYYGNRNRGFPITYVPKLPNKIINLNEVGLVNINGTTFCGDTLWTNFQNDNLSEVVSKEYINDFRCIPEFTTRVCKDLFNKAVKKLVLADVIITHFGPTPNCGHSGFPRDPISKYFCNDIKGLNPRFWLFGHTHDQTDFTDKGTRYLANCRGYASEASKDYKGLIIDV